MELLDSARIVVEVKVLFPGVMEAEVMAALEAEDTAGIVCELETPWEEVLGLSVGVAEFALSELIDI